MRKLALSLGVLLLSSPVLANELNVSLAEIPNLAGMETGGQVSGSLPELMRIVDNHYADGSFSYSVFPFARSINNVVSGTSDMHAPLINVGAAPDAGFQYVDEPLLEVTFVIYSHKDSPVEKTSDFSSLNVDTLIGHSQFFDFKVGEVTSLESGLKKVANKRVDAFIMEQDAVDGMLKDMSLDSIHRAPYAAWGSAIIVKQGPEGDHLNEALSAAIKQAKADPRYTDAAIAVHKPYQDWQP